MALIYDRSDDTLREGFAIVRQYDPALYVHMSIDTWRVSTDVEEVFPGIDYVSWVRTQEAFGSTVASDCGEFGREAHTHINADALTWWAREHDVPEPIFTACVLVHEYAHVPQPCGGSPANEQAAFDATKPFVAKLPAQYVDTICAELDADERNQTARDN